MFDVSPRNRALFESAPGAVVTAMVYGKLAYRHEPQAVKPAKRPSVKPWSNAAMPMDQRDVRRSLRSPRTRKQTPTSTLAVAGLMAARTAHRAALAA